MVGGLDAESCVQVGGIDAEIPERLAHKTSQLPVLLAISLQYADQSKQVIAVCKVCIFQFHLFIVGEELLSLQYEYQTE